MVIETVSLLQSWSFLKFWDYYYSKGMDKIEGLPRVEHRFKALELTPFQEVKCVLLAQDPYPTQGHAHGLAFSVPVSVRNIPGSLRNIFKEYQSDLGFSTPRSGDLSDWARRGVLLLNAVLTVGKSPGSHRGLGWEKLTYEIIRSLNDKRGVDDGDGIVFLLWGRQAQEYRALIDNPRHLTLCAAHPSPLNRGIGFFGTKPFSKANEFLGERKIDWRLE